MTVSYYPSVGAPERSEKGALHVAPQTRDGNLDAIHAAQKVIEYKLSALDCQIAGLQSEKNLYNMKRLSLVQELERHSMRMRTVGRLPIEILSEFLDDRDMAKLSVTSCHFKAMCSVGGKLLVVHLNSPNRELSDEEAANMVSCLRLSAVRSIKFEAKKKGVGKWMHAISRHSGLMHNLTSITVNAGAETGQFIADLCSLFEGLRPNQLRHIHLSGLRTLSTVGTLLANQSACVEDFRVDYFVAGHECELSRVNLPELPNIKSFVFDVADVTDISAELLLSRLSAIRDKQAVKRIYLPHMQITGDSAKILELVRHLREFSSATQIVLRFHHMPLSVREIVSLREDMRRLPAVCISDHFIVAMDAWADWWPSLTEVWTSSAKITGLSVFREQIDFDALGTSATREWLKLSSDQKKIWESDIAPTVLELYKAAQAKKGQHQAAPVTESTWE